MKDAYNLRQQDFDTLLGLFSGDRDEAGRAYEKLRNGLIRFFHFRGCNDPEGLTDETFNRVAAKVSGYESARSSSPSGYIYGFARNILLEQSRTKEMQFQPEHREIHAAAETEDDAREEAVECLSKCLDEFPEHERRLVLEYYSRERAEKIALRKSLADSVGCSPDALYLRIFRIKGRLRTCVEDCEKTILKDFSGFCQ